MLSGGDTVTARFLHREFFSFMPVAKLLLAVNHKPRVRDYSHGFWRRVRLVPFEVRFEGGSAEAHLEDHLRAELPGILTRALAGYREWRARGLEPPAAVKRATAEYRADSDPLGAFLAERCEADPDGRLPAARAWDAYQEWAHAQGVSEAERPARNRFYGLLEGQFSRRHTKAGNLYLGVRLVAVAELDLSAEMKGEGGEGQNLSSPKDVAVRGNREAPSPPSPCSPSDVRTTAPVTHEVPARRLACRCPGAPRPQIRKESSQ